MAMVAPRGTPACLARRGGSWRRNGAPGHGVGRRRGRGRQRRANGLVGEARQWRWARQRRATACSGDNGSRCMREESQRRERSTVRVREGERGTWGRRGTPRRLQGVGRSRRWPACGCGRRPRASRPPGERRRTTGRSQWAGPSWARPGDR